MTSRRLTQLRAAFLDEMPLRVAWVVTSFGCSLDQLVEDTRDELAQLLTDHGLPSILTETWHVVQADHGMTVLVVDVVPRIA